MKKNNCNILENAQMDAIFALNMGDFMTDHLISDDLLHKISKSVNDKIAGLKNQLSELISIYSFDKTLSLMGFNSEEDFILYNSITKTIAQMLDIDACHIFLTDEYAKTLNNEHKFDLILAGTSLENSQEIISKNIGFLLRDESNPLIQAFLTGETISFANVNDSNSLRFFNELNQNKACAYLAVPMVNNSGEVGVICLESHSDKEIISEYRNLIETTARLFVTSMILQELVEETQNMLNARNSTPTELRQLRTELTAVIGDLGDGQQLFVEALATAVDAKGQYEKQHSVKVAETAKKISRQLKLNEKTVDLIYYAGLLQNIGKITLPEEIFNKTEKLSKEDWEKLQNHPNVGVNLLMKINFMSEVVPYIHYHRERWNGKGEPEGLSGISIPLGSRIIAVADAYQAMVSERPYRESISNEKALDILRDEAGVKWDPAVVEALLEVMS